jgi:hypothetical protein
MQGNPDAPGAAADPATRRAFLRSASVVAAGISVLVLPSAAEASSPTSAGIQGDPPSSFTVDDTVAPDEGDDVAYLVTLVGTDGGAFVGVATVTIEVTLDDGADGGIGSPADGTSIDGEEQTVATSTAELGQARFSVRFPMAGTFLLRFTTTPMTVTHPDGVTLFRTVA